MKEFFLSILYNIIVFFGNIFIFFDSLKDAEIFQK